VQKTLMTLGWRTFVNAANADFVVDAQQGGVRCVRVNFVGNCNFKQ